MDITSAIYKTLLRGATEISKQVTENDELTQKIVSNKYSPEAVKEFRERQSELKTIINRAVDNAVREAKAMVKDYRSKIEDQNILDPSAINDDLKLLQAGITLYPKDIKNLMERNSDNRTMQLVIMRYAKEHNIDTIGITYSHQLSEDIDTANNLESIINYSESWMKTDNATNMLLKFFNTTKDYEKQVLDEIRLDKLNEEKQAMLGRMNAEYNL